MARQRDNAYQKLRTARKHHRERWLNNAVNTLGAGCGGATHSVPAIGEIGKRIVRRGKRRIAGAGVANRKPRALRICCMAYAYLAGALACARMLLAMAASRGKAA